MAITVTRVSGPHSIGNRFETVSTVLLDNSYAANGEPLTRADLGFASTVDPTFNVIALPTAGYIPEYDHTNSKLKMYDQKDPAAAGGADIALPEVGNGVDLSAVTVRVIASGRYRG
jgi:hypothetical protein